MTSSTRTSHPTQGYATFDERLSVSKPAPAAVSLADTKNAENLEFYETDLVSLIKKNNYRVHMCVGNTSNRSGSTVCVFGTGCGLNVVCTFLLQN